MAEVSASSLARRAVETSVIAGGPSPLRGTGKIDTRLRSRGRMARGAADRGQPPSRLGSWAGGEASDRRHSGGEGGELAHDLVDDRLDLVADDGKLEDLGDELLELRCASL